jgi:hypothetical protein
MSGRRGSGRKPSNVVNLKQWTEANVWHPTGADWLRLYRRMTEGQRNECRARLEALIARKKREIGAVAVVLSLPGAAK